MARYKIWDKTSGIYTLGTDENGRNSWTAQDYIVQNAPWAASNDVKIIVGAGPINGTVFMEFSATKEAYQRQGAAITDDMTDTEVLAAIEAFEDHPPQGDATAEERIAAALEFQNLMSV